MPVTFPEKNTSPVLKELTGDFKFWLSFNKLKLFLSVSSNLIIFPIQFAFGFFFSLFAGHLRILMHLQDLKNEKGNMSTFFL